MSRISYVNGRYIPHAYTFISMDDRAHYFGDAIYEVIYFKDGQLIDAQPHFDRLYRSLKAIRIEISWSQKNLELILQELIRRNSLKRGIVYFQISRGSGPRDHAFPQMHGSSLIALVKAMPMKDVSKGVKVITTDDIRWKGCHIKCTALLPNVLAKQEAIDKQAYEAWMVNERGYVTDGASTNAYIVTKNKEIWTHPESTAILSGVIRKGLLELAPALKMIVKEKPFTLADAYAAEEAFLSSTTQTVVPVVQINDRVIGNGKPGPITLKLREAYLNLHNLW